MTYTSGFIFIISIIFSNFWAVRAAKYKNRAIKFENLYKFAKDQIECARNELHDFKVNGYKDQYVYGRLYKVTGINHTGDKELFIVANSIYDIVPNLGMYTIDKLVSLGDCMFPIKKKV